MENKDLSAARLSVGALDLEEDPVVAALARVDNLTGILARLLDDDDATLATLQLARERLSVALALLESLLKMRAARTTQSTLSGATQVDFRDKRPPEKTPRMTVSTTGEPFDLPDYLSQVERHWTANMFSRNLWATAFSQFIDSKLLQEEYCRAMAKDGNRWTWEDAKTWLGKKVPQGDILSAHIKSFLNVRATNESTSVFIHRFNNLMSKAQMSDDFDGSHIRQLLTSFVFLQSIPTNLHRELMAFVSQQRRQLDPDADAAVTLLEVPVEVLLDSLRARLGPDTRITVSPGEPQASAVKPSAKSPERPWAKKTPSPSPSTSTISTPTVKSAAPASTEPTTWDINLVRCFSCQQHGHIASKCPLKPMTLEDQNTVAKALALAKQRSHLKATSLNMFKEAFDEEAYQEADAHRLAILQAYRQPKKT